MIDPAYLDAQREAAEDLEDEETPEMRAEWARIMDEAMKGE